uniref:CMP/dCMP deaminase zinc-binding n=1 Tax=Cyanothece sp. (strain PCC 7425 / ATCC 29141) TaxID=395961 RepID=B8HLN7_CYAP4
MHPEEEDLRARANKIRQLYLSRKDDSGSVIVKPVGKANVAVAEVYLRNGVSFGTGATSRGGCKSPIPKPKPKSEGGQFEPSVDSRTNRMMDTDAEYKVLSEIAEILEKSYDPEVEGDLYLYSELQPCQSCQCVIEQFKAKFPNIKIHLFSDLPYP